MFAALWWFLHTEADVSLSKDGQRARLQQNGKQVAVTLAKPAGAAFEVMKAAPLPTLPDPELQASSEDRRKLAVHLQGVTELDLLVEIRPEWAWVVELLGEDLAAGKQDTIARLLQEGGPAIRYRTATELVDDATGVDVEQLAVDLVASTTVQQWVAQIQEPGDMWRYHGSNPDALENACAKLCELGLRAGMLPAFDQRMAPYRRQLAEDPESVWNPITGACLNWAGFHEDAVRDWLRERLGVLYEVAQAGSYDIYIDQDTYGDYPAAFRKRPLVDPQYNGRLVGIWDVYALAHWPNSLASPEAQGQIDAVIAYILHPDYQALDEGYGVMRAGPRRYYSIGWSVHLPGYDGFDFRRPIHAAMFVQRAELMAHFCLARQSAWFKQSLAHLESYRTDRGTYRFPAAYLREQANGYWVSGAYMRLEEDRRRREALELDSTFRMLKIKRLIGEGK